jgi:hypothetical protein
MAQVGSRKPRNQETNQPSVAFQLSLFIQLLLRAWLDGRCSGEVGREFVGFESFDVELDEWDEWAAEVG